MGAVCHDSAPANPRRRSDPNCALDPLARRPAQGHTVASASGEIRVKAEEKDGKIAAQGAFVLFAAYRDRGNQGQPALESGTTLLLVPLLTSQNCDARSYGVNNYKPFNNDTTVLNELKHDAWFVFRQVDLTRAKSLTLRTVFGDKAYSYAGGRMEIRVGSTHGALIGEATFESKNGEKAVFEERTINLASSVPSTVENPLQDVYFIFKNEQNQGQGVIALDWVRFDF